MKKEETIDQVIDIAQAISNAIGEKVKDSEHQVSLAVTALLVVIKATLSQITEHEGVKKAKKIREMIAQRIHAIDLDNNDD